MKLSKILEMENDLYLTPKQNFKSKNKIKDTISYEEREKIAKELVLTQCDYKNILGYCSRDSKNRTVLIKYNKNKEVCVVYFYKNNAPSIISFFMCSWRDYNSMRYEESYPYVDEIPQGA